jgi:hypothetical protein
MKRKVAQQREYDIPFVGINVKTITLNTRQRDTLARLFNGQPSRAFVIAYCYMVGLYVEHKAAVISSTAAAVQKRLEAVADNAKSLQKSLKQLNLTDHTLYDSSMRRGAYRGDPYTTLNQLSYTISHVLPAIKASVARLEKSPKRGRMPAFAEQALAKGLCQLLFEETNVVPTIKKDGAFDRLLSLSLSHAGSAKPRRDVTDLMRHSLKEPPHYALLLRLFEKELLES